MIKIIRFRDFTIKDLQFARLIKPFEDAGLVIDFSRNTKSEVELVYDICNDHDIPSYHFGHILLHESSHETPSTLFKHIHERDEILPTLCSYQFDGKHRKHIEAIRNYHQLQALLGIASERGFVSNASRLL